MGVQRASTVAPRSTARPTPVVARTPAPQVGLLRLQQTAGNAAVAGLVVARQVAPATLTARPTLRRGDLDQQVGVASRS